nr:methyltransferase [Nocardioides malaquae]
MTSEPLNGESQTGETQEPADEAGEHYFTADPDAPFAREPFTCEVWGHEFELVSAPGVFSRGHLDHATAVLLRELDPPPMGQFLDLGCGYGPIGIAIAKAVPLARVIGVDVNERALKLANENAKANKVAGTFAAVTPDQVPSDYVFDEIWSNPPIRIGKEALHALLLTWLPRLAPGGRMVSVVGKNLGGDSLQKWLTEQGWPTTRLASSKGFRVLETRRP